MSFATLHRASRQRGHGAPATGAPTVGVEEELTLLDPATGAVAPRAAAVIRDCRDPGGVVAESMRYVVETRTPVCGTLADVRRELSVRRQRVAEVAGRHGVLSVATGVAPFGLPDPPLVTAEPRYRELARRFPRAMGGSGMCGCHVHVAVPDRQAGVEALLRLRPWLPTLIALTANSPIWQGADSGWASRRLVLESRWPTGVPAPPVRSVEEYDLAVGAAVSSGAALDVRSVYYLARLSPRYPTIEVRVADVALTVDDALGYAGLVRALVAASLDEAAGGRPAVDVPSERLGSSCRSAARAGLGGDLIDPRTGDPVSSWELVDLLAEQVRPYLRAHGDEEDVLPALRRLRAQGGGADRQRRMFRAAPSRGAFAEALAAASGDG